MKKPNDKRIMILLLILLLFLCVGMGCYIWQSHQVKDPFQEDENSQLGIMPGMSNEEIQERLNKVLADNMMNITINPRPVFENGRSEGRLCIQNIKQNHVNYIITIKLDDNQKQIYESGLLRPDHFIDKAELDVNLHKGVYPATAYFKAYNDKKKFVGSSMVKMSITIRN